MSSFLNDTDIQVVGRKMANGVLQRLFLRNRDVDVIITSKEDQSLKEFIATLDTDLADRENQNAFSTITVGDVSIVSSNTTDEVVIIPGNGMTVTADAANKTLTLGVPDVTDSAPGLMTQTLLDKLNDIEYGANAYEHPTYNVPPGTDYLRVSVDEYGHVYSANKNVITVAEGGTGASTAAEARTNLGAASTDEASASAAGLMSTAMYTFVQDLITNGLNPSSIPVSYITEKFVALGLVTS